MVPGVPAKVLLPHGLDLGAAQTEEEAQSGAEGHVRDDPRVVQETAGKGGQSRAGDEQGLHLGEKRRSPQNNGLSAESQSDHQI